MGAGTWGSEAKERSRSKATLPGEPRSHTRRRGVPPSLGHLSRDSDGSAASEAGEVGDISTSELFLGRVFCAAHHGLAPPGFKHRRFMTCFNNQEDVSPSFFFILFPFFRSILSFPSLSTKTFSPPGSRGDRTCAEHRSQTAPEKPGPLEQERPGFRGRSAPASGATGLRPARRTRGRKGGMGGAQVAGAATARRFHFALNSGGPARAPPPGFTSSPRAAGELHFLCSWARTRWELPGEGPVPGGCGSGRPAGPCLPPPRSLAHLRPLGPEPWRGLTCAGPTPALRDALDGDFPSD